MKAQVNGLRSIELGVPDLGLAIEFYQQVWGLNEVSREGATAYLAGTGKEHHVLSLTEQKSPSLVSIALAALDKPTVDAIHAKVTSLGASVAGAPQCLAPAAGGGYGFAVVAPEGQQFLISCDLASWHPAYADASKPEKLSHVVLNAVDIEQQQSFLCDVLGFRLSDSTAHMEFLRCSRDHHSIALARNGGPSLNHVAYELPDFDGLMRGSGRLKDSGFEIEWGVGRHGPGNNIFSYFVDPIGFVAEYTTEFEKVDESRHVPQPADYWKRIMGGKRDQWGLARPSERLQQAMSGSLKEAINLTNAA